MSQLLGIPKFIGLDADGDPLTGGKLHTYIPGTTTNKATYSDKALTTANANPIVLDSRGEAVVYLSGSTKLVLKTAADVTIWTVDAVEGTPQSSPNTYLVDASEADQGAAGSGRSLKDIIDAVGTSQGATIVFTHSGTGNTTTYTVDTSETVPSNFKVVIEEGAILDIQTGDTLTIYSPENIIASKTQQIFDGVGIIAFTVSGTIYPEWWGATGDGTTDDSTALLAAATIADGADGFSVKLQGGLTYLCDDEPLTIHKCKWVCDGQATLKFDNLGAAEDCVTIQGSAAEAQAGLSGINIDANSTGRDAVVFSGGKTGDTKADFPFFEKTLVSGAVRDGIHIEPSATNHWIENMLLKDVRVFEPGRHCLAFIQPDLATTFINKGVGINIELRGAGQSETGYEIYADGQGSAADMKISEWVWLGLELDAKGAANHGVNAIHFTESGSYSYFDAWVFNGLTAEDTGSVAGLTNVIGIDSGADVRGLVINGGVLSDYTAFVTEDDLGGNALILPSNSGSGYLKIRDSAGNFIEIADDVVQWGAVGGSADVNLYRVAENRLKSDDAIEAVLGFGQTRNVITSTAGAITLVEGTNQVNLIENVTGITMPTAVDGRLIEVAFCQAAAANYTVGGWPGTVRLAGSAYTATATNAKIDVLTFRYNSGKSAWLEVSRSMNL